MTRAALAGLCIAVALQAQPPRDTPPPAPSGLAGTASIEGTVLSDEAQPKKLRRALVTLSGSSVPGARVEIADDEGRFRFTGLRGGQYALTASREGYVGRFYGSAHPVPSGRAPTGPANLSIHDGETQTVAMRLPRGAAISGSVTDADGQPMAGTIVVVMADRFEPAAGVRRLTARDITTTDDRGMYRSFGLPAGQYVVYVQTYTPYDSQEIKRTTSDSRSVIPANIYFPSTPDGDRAARITLAAGEERAGIDVQVQYVPTATVKGFVSGGMGPSGGAARLYRPNDPAAGAFFMGNAGIAPDGQFTFTNVPPGRYQIQAQSMSAAGGPSGSTSRRWMSGTADIVVEGDDVSNVGIQLMPPFTISGRLVFEGSPPPPLAATSLPAAIFPSLPSGVPPPVELLDGGKFSISGLTPGVYRPNTIGGPPRGLQTPIGSWWLTSIAVDGREVLDAPLELRQGSDNAVVTFSDRASEVVGSVKDAAGAPVTRGDVVIFSADRAHWFVSSRRVVAVAPAAGGRYSIRNLPPGEYRAAIALDLEQGEWFDPDVLQSLVPNAIPLTITGVETKTLDLVLR